MKMKRYLSLMRIFVLLLLCQAPILSGETIFYDDFSYGSTPSTQAENLGRIWEEIDGVGDVDYYAGTDECLYVEYEQYNDKLNLHSIDYWHSSNFTITLDIKQCNGTPNAETINQIWICNPVDSNGLLDEDSGYFVQWYQTPAGVDYFGIYKCEDGSYENISTAGYGHGTDALSFGVFNRIQIDVLIDSNSIDIDFYMRKTSEIDSDLPQILRAYATDELDGCSYVNGLGMSFHTRDSSPNYADCCVIDNVLVDGEKEARYGEFQTDPFDSMYPRWVIGSAGNVLWDSDMEAIEFIDTSNLYSKSYFSDLQLNVNESGRGIQCDYIFSSTSGSSIKLFAFTQSEEDLGYYIDAYTSGGKGYFIADSRLNRYSGNGLYPTAWSNDPQVDIWYTLRVEPYNDEVNDYSWVEATVRRCSDNYLMSSILLYDPNSTTRLSTHKGMAVKAYPGTDKVDIVGDGLFVDNVIADVNEEEPLTAAQVWAEGFGVSYDLDKDCVMNSSEYANLQNDSSIDANSVVNFSTPPCSRQWGEIFSDDFGRPTDLTKWQRVDSSANVPDYAVLSDKRLHVQYFKPEDYLDLHSLSRWHSNNFTLTLDIQQDTQSDPQLANAESINQIWLFRPIDPNGNIDIDSGYYVQWYQSPAGTDYFGVYKCVNGVVQNITTGGTGNGTNALPGTSYYNTIQIDVEVIDKTVCIDFYMRAKSEIESGLPQILRGSGTDTSGDYLRVNGVGVKFKSGLPTTTFTGKTYIDDVLVVGEPERRFLKIFGDSFDYPASPSNCWIETEYSGDKGSPAVPVNYAGTLTDDRYRVVYPTLEDANGNTDPDFANNCGAYLQSILDFHSDKFRVTADFQIDSAIDGQLCQIWLFTPLDNIGRPSTGYRIQWFRQGSSSSVKVVRFVDGVAYVVPNTEIVLNGMVQSSQYYTVTLDVEVADDSVDFDMYFNEKGDSIGSMGSSSGSDTTANRLTQNHGIGIGLAKYNGYGGISYVDNVYVEGYVDDIINYNPKTAIWPNVNLIREDPNIVSIEIDNIASVQEYADEICILIDSTYYGSVDLTEIANFSFSSTTLDPGNHLAKFIFVKDECLVQQVEKRFVSVDENPLAYDLGTMDFSKYYPAIQVVDSNEVSVAKSVFKVYDHGARPSSIEVESTEILNGAIAYKVGQSSLTSESNSQLETTNTNYVVFSGDASCDNIDFDEIAQIDYDGFMWSDVEVSLPNLSSREICVEIPIQLSGDIYYSYGQLTFDSAITTSGVDRGSDVGSYMSWADELPQGTTTIPLTSNISISNHSGGLVVYLSNIPANLNIEDYDEVVEIYRNGQNVTIKIYVSDGVNAFDSTDFEFSYGIQPIPVRDLDVDYNLTHLRKVHRPAYYKLNIDTYEEMGVSEVIMHQTWTEMQGYYTAFERYGDLTRTTEEVHDANMNFNIYLGSHISSMIPESYLYLDYFKRGEDQFFRDDAPVGTSYIVCYGGPWGDVFLKGLDQLLDEVPIDGFYMDGTLCILPCTNEKHGHRILDSNGRVVPYYNTLEMRRFSQLLYEIGQDHNTEFTLDAHTSGHMLTPATMGLVTNTWTGEHVQYNNSTWKVPLDVLSAQFDGNLWGIPVEHLRYWNRTDWRRDMAGTLLFNTLPRLQTDDDDDAQDWYELTVDLWDIFTDYNLTNDYFIPYYDANSEISATNGILISYYDTPNNVVVIVSNYNNSSQVSTTVDMGDLSTNLGSTGVDLLDGNNVTLSNGSFDVAVLGENFRMFKFSKQ